MKDKTLTTSLPLVVSLFYNRISFALIPLLAVLADLSAPASQELRFVPSSAGDNHFSRANLQLIVTNVAPTDLLGVMFEAFSEYATSFLFQRAYDLVHFTIVVRACAKNCFLRKCSLKRCCLGYFIQIILTHNRF